MEYYLAVVGITVLVVCIIWALVNHSDKKKIIEIKIQKPDEFYKLDIYKFWDELEEKTLCVKKKEPNNDENT